MRMIGTLAASSIGSGIASFLFATSADFTGSFMPAWFGVASVACGLAALITGGAFLAQSAHHAESLDRRDQQIADANLKQIEHRGDGVGGE